MLKKKKTSKVNSKAIISELLVTWKTMMSVKNNQFYEEEALFSAFPFLPENTFCPRYSKWGLEIHLPETQDLKTHMDR